MGIPRRLRPLTIDKENSPPRLSRPWDNPPSFNLPSPHPRPPTLANAAPFNIHQALSAPPPPSASNPLSAFFPPPPSPHSPSDTFESHLRPHQHPDDDDDEDNDEDYDSDHYLSQLHQNISPEPQLRTQLGHRQLKPLVAPRMPPPLIGLPIPKPSSTMQQVATSNPRYSVRHSIRLSAAPSLPPPPAPDAPLTDALQPTPSASSFDDPDSFDTFATIPDTFNINDDEGPPPAPSHPPAPPQASSPSDEKPVFPFMSLGPTDAKSAEEDDGALDVPAPLATSPAADRAMRDLQRASVTAATELAASIRMLSNNGSPPKSGAPISPGISRMPGSNKLQGQLYVRTRIFRRWNLRYATIIQQAFFGPVLLLFRPDNKPIFPGGMALKSSKMIALAQSSVRVIEITSRRQSAVRAVFELTTSQRTYILGCTDESSRSLWMDNLSNPPS